jgi:hypothetical protein
LKTCADGCGYAELYLLHYRHGGQCYKLCDGRTVISNITSYGALGSYRGAGVENKNHIYCLWMLSVPSSTENFSGLMNRKASVLPVPNITLTIHSELLQSCHQVRGE